MGIKRHATLLNKKKDMVFSSFPLFLFSSFLLWQTLKVTGFCTSELRYLPERELLERYIVRSNSVILGSDTLTDAVKENINFPACCRLHDTPAFIPKWNVALSTVFFNRRLYGVEVHFKYEDIKNAHIYSDKSEALNILSDIDSCGVQVDRDRYSHDESRVEYLGALKVNDKYWRTH